VKKKSNNNKNEAFNPKCVENKKSLGQMLLHYFSSKRNNKTENKNILRKSPWDVKKI
jgi:hypothetical protein